MNKIPKKINLCPIEQSILEFRFTTDFPADAVFGIIFSAVKDLFPSNEIIQLPAQQIPEQIRRQDPNLKFQALQRLVNGNLSLSIGPNVLVFGNHKEYLGWNNWSKFFNDVLSKIKTTGLLKSVERIGLRYTNIFDKNIFENANIDLLINNKKLLNETSNLRTEINDSGFIKILQIGNAVNIISNNTTRIGSIIDIDCIFNCTKENFFETYLDIINKAHDKEKELFFEILKDKFIIELGPEY